MSLFPIFLKLAQQPALVIGAGSLAEPRIDALVESGAMVKVIAPRAAPKIKAWGASGRISWQPRRFEPGDVEGHRLVFAATGVKEVDRLVTLACRERGIPCNAIDDPSYCDFYSPAVVRRGDLQIAISTNGQSPMLAQLLRVELERQFDASWAARVDELGQRRRKILASVAPGQERKRLLQEIARDALAKDNGTAIEGTGRQVEDTANHNSRPGADGLLVRAGRAIGRWLEKADEQVWLT